jgi:hypothetical protein
MSNNDIPCCVVSSPLVSLCATACNLNKAPCRWRDSRKPDPCPLTILREMKQLETLPKPNYCLCTAITPYPICLLVHLLLSFSAAHQWPRAIAPPTMTRDCCQTKQHQPLLLLYQKGKPTAEDERHRHASTSGSTSNAITHGTLCCGYIFLRATLLLSWTFHQLC